jgi:hypothetical protein
MRPAPLRRAGRFAAVAALMTGLATVSGVGTASAAPSVQAQLAQVRAATAAFHSIAAAENRGGYVKFLDCFDDATQGGMGQHWLLADALGKPLDLRSPAALVYEPEADGSYQLVAVEYVVPDPDKTMTDDPPQLLGQTFTYLDSLGVWKLHAWIWRPNPNGMFKDYNPSANMCPTT